MNAISPRSTAAIAAALPAAPAAPAAPTTSRSRDDDAPSASGGDALASMRPAMDAASAADRLTDTAAGAAGVLATGGSYLQGATRTLAKLDQGIEQRTREIERLRHTDPAAAEDKQGQLDMLQRLRDRIQLSIERVGDILSGHDRDDIGGPDPNKSDPRMSHHGLDGLTGLEQRRQLLAPSMSDNLTAPGSALVAGHYAAASAAG